MHLYALLWGIPLFTQRLHCHLEVHSLVPSTSILKECLNPVQPCPCRIYSSALSCPTIRQMLEYDWVVILQTPGILRGVIDQDPFCLESALSCLCSCLSSALTLRYVSLGSWCMLHDFFVVMYAYLCLFLCLDRWVCMCLCGLLCYLLLKQYNHLVPLRYKVQFFSTSILKVFLIPVQPCQWRSYSSALSCPTIRQMLEYGWKCHSAGPWHS